MKKLFLFPIICLLCTTGYSMGAKTPEGVSLLLVPARPAMVQLGMDMAAQEHAVLMTYALGTPTDQLFLHIWDGREWLRVPQTNYESGTFIKNSVSRFLVIGEENDLTAALIENAMLWSPEVLLLGTTNVTELINQMGRLYGFKKNDWVWIANRYELQLEDLNRDRPQSSWYDANKASDLPPSETPWKKTKASKSVESPETSLSPLMVPEIDYEELSPATTPSETESSTEEIPVKIEDSSDYSLEVE